MRRLLFLVFLCLYLNPLRAQNTNEGTDFWMCFLENYNSVATLKLYISSSQDSKVKISVPLDGFADSFKIQADSVYVYIMPNTYGTNSWYDSVLPRGIHITSDFPVAVSAMNLQTATTDASIVLPTVNIPRGPVYITGHPLSTGFGNLFGMVAIENNTRVTITPSVTTSGGHAAWQPYDITLDKGELYQVISGVTSNADLTGSVIEVQNDKKLVVFSGDVCSNYPCGACDHQYEQVLPQDVLDTAYLVPPHFGHRNGYLVKIVPLDTSTDITINGVLYKKVSYKNSLKLTISSGDTALYIRSDKRFRCYQFMKGGNCNGYVNSGYGDPSMVTYLSSKYFAESSLFSTVNSSNLKDHFVNIVIRTASKNDVYIDRTQIDSSEFIPFQYAPGYSYAMIKVNLGSHHITCSNGHLAYAYGVGPYESYMYLAGFNLPNFDVSVKDSAIRYDCQNQEIDYLFKPVSKQKIKTIFWDYGDGTSGSGNPGSHTYTSFGNYKIKMIAEDFSGQKDSVTQTIRIGWPDFNPLVNKVTCGKDTGYFYEKNPFFANFLWSDGSTGNSFKIAKNSDIWVTATDTTGFCKFKDSARYGFVEINANMSVTKNDSCYKYNNFFLSDAIDIKEDTMLMKQWIIPGEISIFDTTDLSVHLKRPGLHNIYLDVYTPTCKARFNEKVYVYSGTKIKPMVEGDTFCAGTPVKLYDESILYDGVIDSIQWDFDDSTSVSSSSGVYHKTFSERQDGEIVRYYKHITITDAGCRDTAVNIITVWPAPAANFTIDIDSIQCLPTARWTYTSTTQTPNGETSDLYWNTGNGRTGTSNAMKNIRYNAPGKYKVMLIATTPHGCPDTSIKWVEAVPLPKVKFYVNDSSQCFNEHLFNFTDSSKGDYLTHLWNFADGRTSAEVSPDSVQYLQAGTYTVKLKVSTPYQGCIDSFSRKITILRNPAADFTANNDTQCFNNNRFSFTNLSSLYLPYASTAWQWLNNTDTNFHLSAVSFADTGSYKLTMRITDKEGCSDSADKYIVLHELPDLRLSVNDSVQCSNSNRFVFYSPSKSGESNTWYIDNNSISGQNGDSLVYVIPGDGKHRISVKKQAVSGCTDTLGFSVTVLPKPEARFIANRDTQCFSNQKFDFTNTSQAAGDLITDNRFYLNTTIVTGSPGLTGHVFPAAGAHPVSLKIVTAEGCSDSISKTMQVIPEPVLRILPDSNCLNELSNIDAVQVSGQAIASWLWQLGDGSSSNSAPLFTHLYKKKNRYTLTLKATDMYGCTAEVTQTDGIVIFELPESDFSFAEVPSPTDQTKVLFTPAVLSAGNSYNWQFPDGSTSSIDTPSIFIDILLSGKAVLTVTNVHQCSNSTEKDLYLYPAGFESSIPNAFSPNGDRINDRFSIKGIAAATKFKCSIWNRWGEQLFSSDSLDFEWDGTYRGEKVQEGVYLYRIEFIYLDNIRHHYEGTVTLLR